jgi:hypothetical protein
MANNYISSICHKILICVKEYGVQRCLLQNVVISMLGINTKCANSNMISKTDRDVIFLMSQKATILFAKVFQAMNGILK